MAFNEYDEEKPFLRTTEDGTLPSNETIKKKPSWTRIHYLLFVLHAAFLAANVGFMVFNMSANHTYSTSSSKGISKRPDDVQEIYSPARNVIEHEIRIPNVEPKGPFVGLPRPELDEAWSDLLRPAMLDMPPAEMKKMNKSSVAVKGTGGYVGYYAVFHQLHCLKRLYQWTHKESYQDVIDDGRLTAEHYDHCIEVIRSALMCQPDLTVHTVHFDSQAPHGLKGYSHHERKCIKWEPFKEWVDKKAIPAPLQDHVLDEAEEGSFGP
ncbi:hypothetical protein CB0940_10477 [Cercospora beticola]|uniref:Cyclochlorotine biosynthesis protein O n=1 Tax=Cercospora beticola TaxID=122368 RepID=A0A2G5HTR8_CERBT|nr:hypothetical protein CB0940_10477 [Cercospora beticola]PIA95928.1 hypothetical protein CB0940_10477 [Cercospora beticola]WPB07195.1 hypothetical protein RHO25_011856 [Cercospora beticola]CAK1367160.1 unnamed protein product [Cercospora beticola]